MESRSKDYQKILLEYWNQYIVNSAPMPEEIPHIRPVIYESWKRSKGNGVYPFEIKDATLKKEDLDQLLRRNQNLIQVSHSYIQNLYSHVKGSNFIIALTDNHGYVIDLVGQDKKIQDRAKRSGLTLGCSRNESYAGTNGIGTCLETGAPIQIWGCEHYIEPHHNYVCSAAPIRDPRGIIIGCLDFVGPVEAVHSHTLAMVCAAVDGIEKELKMKESYERITMVNNQLLTTIQSINSGIIMVDNLGIITQYNERAKQFLRLPRLDLFRKNLANIIDFDKSSMNILDTRKDFANREVTLCNNLGTSLNLSLTASIIYDGFHEKQGILFVIEEQRRVHKLVSKMSGFFARYTFESIICGSPAMEEAINIGKLAAQNDSTVLILGESGTGKELMAQAIHNASDRASGPFIAINCSSLPRGLIESELFGYEGGSFTGANKDGNPGKFELASGGTIFLDEIGDMPLDLQATLLRVIQTREITRIGGKMAKPVDVRIMAATNVNLAESVQNKNFREDLYYRLNVFPVLIPPLEQRKEDIPVLIDHFIQGYDHRGKSHISGISNEALEVLMAYSWPGNVRELQNIIERMVNMSEGPLLTERDVPDEILKGIPTAPVNFSAPILKRSPAGMSTERSRIIDQLRTDEGNVTKTAAALGIPKRTLYRKLDKYSIDPSAFRL